MTWNSIKDSEPPKNTPLWGYDVFYGDVTLVWWQFNSRNDYGLPSLYKIDNEHDDDNYFYFWKLAEIPDPPNKEQVDRDFPNERQ